MLTLGEEIARLRESHGWTQPVLAEKIGHEKPTTISKYENNHQRPGARALAALSKALGVPVSHWDAFGGAHNRHAPKLTKRKRDATPPNILDADVEPTATIPLHTQDLSSGGFLGMLTPREQHVVTAFRVAVADAGGDEAGALNATLSALAQFAHPKSHRRSGGDV